MTYVYNSVEYEDLEEALEQAFDDLTDGEKIELWIECCGANYYNDDRIYDMGELDYMLENKTASEILEMARGNDFNPNSDYFKFTTYGIESSNSPDSWIEFSDMKDWLIGQFDKYNSFLDVEEKDETEDE